MIDFDMKPGHLGRVPVILMAALLGLAAVPGASQEDGEAMENIDEAVVAEPRILSKEEVKQMAFDVYDKVWAANADLFKAKKKRPKMYFSHQKKGNLGGLHRVGRNSFKIFAQSCQRSEGSCAFVIAHELAHVLTSKKLADDPNFERPMAGSDCDVPAYEVIADTVARKMIMRAGFEARWGGYEQECGLTKFIEADMAGVQRK
ncbi:MAG: hypothetical protein ISN29_06445 [Gammaproteobacteria bacterium AqS3]|nr:hypothetical protein [Gammaproteobacteria bacterium AqS3]